MSETGMEYEDGLTGDIDGFLQKVAGNMGAEVERLARQVVGLARVYAPVDTGALKGDIAIQDVGRDATGPFADVGNSADIPYAVYQEFGTHKMKPHPYIRPAMLAAGLKPTSDTAPKAGSD